MNMTLLNEHDVAQALNVSEPPSVAGGFWTKDPGF